MFKKNRMIIISRRLIFIIGFFYKILKTYNITYENDKPDLYKIKEILYKTKIEKIIKSSNY